MFAQILAQRMKRNKGDVVIFTNFTSEAGNSLEYNLKPYLQIKQLVEEGYIKTIVTESHDGL